VAARYYDFYQHYEPFVRAFIARRVPVDSVNDLVAEVFVVAWRRREVMPDSALPWLYRVARNVVGDSYRAADRLRALEVRLASVPAEAAMDPADVAAERAQLFAALSSLSSQDRDILFLAAWEGLDAEGIGLVLRISAGSAAVRLHRARKRLDKSIAVVDDASERRL